MVALSSPSLDEARTSAPAGSKRRSRPRYWRGVVLLIAVAYFLVPLWAALRFALRPINNPSGWTGSAFTSITSQQGFAPAIELSLRLAVATTLITLFIMVPTAVFVHLRVPRLRGLFDGITILPIVIPPVILIIGMLQLAPLWLRGSDYLLALEYAVLAMPFVYRSLDAGLRALDLKTLTEASRSLGGRWATTLWRVIVPNLRTALLSATVLTVALVLGEFTMASLDLRQTFPVWIYNFAQSSGPISVSASLMSLFVTFLVLMIISSFDLRRIRRNLAAKEA